MSNEKHQLVEIPAKIRARKNNYRNHLSELPEGMALKYECETFRRAASIRNSFYIVANLMEINISTTIKGTTLFIWKI